MGFIAVVIVALLLLSAGEGQLRFWEVIRFLAVGVPLNFVLHLAGGWVLGKIVSVRHDSATLRYSTMAGLQIPPEVAAQVARDPLFNAAKFLLWSGKWVIVIAAGLAVAR